MKRARENALKIGKTSRTPEERAEELSATTGVSTPYVVVHSREVKNMDECEKKVHKKLSNYRYRKEFFDIDVKTAIEVVDEVCDLSSPDSLFISIDEFDKLPLTEKIDLDCLYIKRVETLFEFGSKKKMREPYVSRECIELISKNCIEWTLDKVQKEKSLICTFDSTILIENKKQALELLKRHKGAHFNNLYIESMLPLTYPPSPIITTVQDKFESIDDLGNKMKHAFDNYLSELIKEFKLLYLKDEYEEEFGKWL